MSRHQLEMYTRHGLEMYTSLFPPDSDFITNIRCVLDIFLISTAGTCRQHRLAHCETDRGGLGRVNRRHERRHPIEYRLEVVSCRQEGQTKEASLRTVFQVNGLCCMRTLQDCKFNLLEALAFDASALLKPLFRFREWLIL